MINTKNSALLFDPIFFFIKNTLTDQNFTLPFKNHEIFGGVAHVSDMAQKLTFIRQHSGFFFFARSGGQRDVIFHKKNIHTILLNLFRK